MSGPAKSAAPEVPDSLKWLDEYKPPKDHPLDPGAIVYNLWGYDQTNVDFWLVTKRSKFFLSLVKLQAHEFSDGPTAATGLSVPKAGIDGKPVRDSRTTRRSYRNSSGNWYIKAEHGVMTPWDGKPKHYSSYG